MHFRNPDSKRVVKLLAVVSLLYIADPNMGYAGDLSILTTSKHQASLRLLLGSGGIRTAARKKLWRKEADTLLGNVTQILFIPYALRDHPKYLKMVRKMNLGAGRRIVSIDSFSDPVAAVNEAEAIFMGGGNTFRLLKTLHEKGLIAPIRRRVAGGMPYLGASAGTNVATRVIGPTNDMPITQTPFQALGLVGITINPHYVGGAFYVRRNGRYIRHHGETRDKRLTEFLEENPGAVLGMHEGTIIRVENGEAVLLGAEGKGARLFQMTGRQRKPKTQSLKPGTDITSLVFPTL